jgi:hypothetical protein
MVEANYSPERIVAMLHKSLFRLTCDFDISYG